MKNFLILFFFILAFNIQFGYLPVIDFLGHWGINLVAGLLLAVTLFRPLRESIFWSFLAGLALDALYFDLGRGFFFLILPFLALANHFFLKKVWSGHLTALGFSLFMVFLVLTLEGLVLLFSFWGTASFSLTEFFWSRRFVRLVLANGLLTAPAFFFFFRWLNQLFEYWEQKKSI